MLEGIKYIVFDLNGTLVVGNYPAYNEVLEDRMGLRRKGEEGLSKEKLRLMARGERTFEELVSLLYEVTDPKEARKEALRLYTSDVRPRKNAIEVLEQLSRGFRLILCSDTTGVAKEVVKIFNLERYFDVNFYSCDLGHLKGEEEFWRRCLFSFPNASPSEFLIVGDNPRADTYWPRKIGMRTVLIRSDISSPQDYVDKPRGAVEEEPDFFIEDLEEILNLLSTNPGRNRLL